MKKVLNDHKRVKKKLIPPLIDAMGRKHRPYSWVKELIPELVWLCLLHENLGLRRGVECASQIAELTKDIASSENIPFLCKISSFLKLSDEEKEHLVLALDKSGHLSDIRTSLKPLFEIFPSSPLAFFDPECTETENIPNIFSHILPKLYDRYSKEATFVNATAVSMGVVQGKLIMAMEEASPLSEIDEVEHYPDTEKSKMVASSLRAMVGTFLMIPSEDEVPYLEWTEKFWRKLSNSGACFLNNSTAFYDEENYPDDDLGRMVFKFCDAAKKELHERIDKWGFDLNEIETYEVIGGLLARQTTLAVDLAIAPMVWNPSSSPLFHRAMADIYITLCWIFEDPKTRAMSFIENGIGDIKLEVEHRKKHIKETGEKDPQELKLIEIYEDWISSQRHKDMVEVNLANWSGITTRKMAEESGCLDFYNYVYQPFSAAVHPSWSHIHMQNLQHCSHPAHRNHNVPVVRDFGMEPHFLYLGAKYLQKAFSKFDEKTGIKVESVSAFDQLYDDLYGKGDDQDNA